MTFLTTGKIIFAMFPWAICVPLITIGIACAPQQSFATLRAAMAGLVLVGLALPLRRVFPDHTSGLSGDVHGHRISLSGDRGAVIRVAMVVQRGFVRTAGI